MVSPSQVRHALASTPTQPRSIILRKGMTLTKRFSLRLTKGCVHDNDNILGSFSNAEPSSRVGKTLQSASRTPQRVSAAFRRTDSEVRPSVANEDRFEQAAAAKSPSKPAATSSSGVAVVAETPKRGRGPGCPSKGVVSAAVRATASNRRRPSIGSQAYTLPPESPVETTARSSTSKRKLGSGSQPYRVPQPMLETPRKRRKSTPGKTVKFAEPLDEDTEHEVISRYVFDTPISSSKKKGKAAAKGKAPVRAKAVKSVAASSWIDHDDHVVTSRVKFDGSSPSSSKKGKVAKKTSKAATAGKLVKKRNEAKAKAKVAEKVVRTTRSGASYTI